MFDSKQIIEWLQANGIDPDEVTIRNVWVTSDDEQGTTLIPRRSPKKLTEVLSEIESAQNVQLH